jgi:hypothetical protein
VEFVFTDIIALMVDLLIDAKLARIKKTISGITQNRKSTLGRDAMVS